VSCFDLSFSDVLLILYFRICSLRNLELFEKAKAAGAAPCPIRNYEIANGISKKQIAKHLQELALSSIPTRNAKEDPSTNPPNPRGESGFWAVGDEGEIFGYLVATCEQLGAIYVAPLALAMTGIRARHKIKDVRIPGPVNPSPRAAVSDRAGGLLSLHEDHMVETGRILGTSGTEEKLDYREYLLDPHVRFGSNS
jgi:hypothetical protein